MSETQEFRVERDSLGEMRIPAGAYWGVNTARALENFSISRRQISVYPDFIVAYAQVKQAAARANLEIGVLDQERSWLIDRACQDIIDGKLHEEFVVGVIQGGAGTSTNMNVNEVIANRALELAGREFGDYEFLSPNDHVNRSQSTNDTYPSAVKVALVHATERLIDEFTLLQNAFRVKGSEFKHILKIGRTQLQDAVPMTLGQEFSGFSTTIGEDIQRLRDVLPLLLELNLGATAIGTGITAEASYASAVMRQLRKITGYNDLQTAHDLIEATSDTGVFMSLSSVIKRTAMKLSKICNDLRLLSSGPQAGLGEINLPARQAGSSIMPGKVNPVIPEAVNQVAFVIAGADVTVSMASEAGQLQLNAFEPVMLHTLMQNSAWLRRAARTLRVNCIDGITANEELLASRVSSSVGVVTALTPYIGYSEASKLAKEALTTKSTIADLVVERGLLSREEVTSILSPERLSGIQAVTSAIPIITQAQATALEDSLDRADLRDFS
ncbi:aspartate ammonia-lyase [Pseudoclavibacter sp. RFBJ3]|uniref:aspartate ammonia-lyase n=1 Tax=unclassified Pseudoclavibacter TaxID=2615177 RepID=UPI000CE8415F|nr:MULTISPECIES: aspartate ammonia-lyase [unclassified Pseudoclavibacter]MBF4458047.1 aspartate ammonia-lyase [Pseudoclavibacter sp. VKM Ac-2867]MBF4549567.1 aspartate ammonia-lyase [Pseudoclavibacter sp. VKM Ac-2888]PPF39889.1 aspartate ammonia-lyase [Pseudoclavibacter sp. AY1H1]PPF76052.1 aspartate ammonia-lyase [Pseudoclavibacter sp. Z016]PPF84852.1 aspartate ammonia-lyase [Pseudoclavibacter sp. RFBJ5]